jgi:hypothetical protein
MRNVRTKRTPNEQEFPEKWVFDKRKNVFLNECVGKPTDFKSPPMVRQYQLVEDFARFKPVEPAPKRQPKR